MWATGHAVNIERIERWHRCECGMPFPCGLPIVVRLLECPLLSALFTGIPFVEVKANQRILTGEARQDIFSSFAPFYLKMAYYEKIS